MNSQLAYELLTNVTHPGGTPMILIGANGVPYRIAEDNLTYELILDPLHLTNHDYTTLKMFDKFTGRQIYYDLGAMESIDIMPSPIIFTFDTLTLDLGTEIEVNVIFNKQVEIFTKETIRLTNAKVTTDPTNLDSGVGFEWKFGITGQTVSTDNTLKINIDKLGYKYGTANSYKNSIGMLLEERDQVLYLEAPDKFSIS